jgi:hypothetical protein
MGTLSLELRILVVEEVAFLFLSETVKQARLDSMN